MQISDLSTQLQLKLGTGANRNRFLSSLRPGQILQAEAMSLNTNGRVRLRVGNYDVVAQTRLQTNVGQKLSLAVVKGGALPELHLIQAASNADLRALALKSALPRQVPLDQMLNNLTRVGNQPFVAQSPELREAIRRLFEGLPSTAGLQSGQQLSHALRETGLFMESHLMRGGGQPVDLKANLLRLLFQLNSSLKSSPQNAPAGKASAAPPTLASSGPPQSAIRPEGTPTTPEQVQSTLLRELTSQTEGALARIQLNQLASLPGGERESQVWQLDLPLRHDDQTDVFLLHVEQETPPANHTDTPGWMLTLRFDLNPLGPIEARVTLSELSISTHFWAAKGDTRTRIEQQLPHLERAFDRLGLSAARFTVHQGIPPEPPPVKSGSPILDVKA